MRTWIYNECLVQKLVGGVIVEVGTLKQASIAEDAGAVAVVVKENHALAGNRMLAVDGMTNPDLLCAVKKTMTIPVIARCRAGHFTEAHILEHLGADGVEECDNLTPADESHHIWKRDFEVPFLCEVYDLTDTLCRIIEGAAILRTGDGTGNITETIRTLRNLVSQLRLLRNTSEAELMTHAQGTGISLELIEDIKEQGCLPVPVFAAGGISTPADAALVMKIGMQGVFIEEEIFQTLEPTKRLAAIVRATRFPNYIDFIAELSRNL